MQHVASSPAWYLLGRKLSPAYDLTHAVSVSRDRRDLAMACGDADRFANADNLLSQSARFLLEPGQATAIVDAVEAQVRGTWYATARAAGVSERDCEAITRAFAYPGFRQTAVDTGAPMTTERVLEILAQAKRLAREFRIPATMQLGDTGEVAGYEAAHLLGVDLQPARAL
jgi:hypothetical protein